jgi:hypothetical protein
MKGPMEKFDEWRVDRFSPDDETALRSWSVWSGIALLAAAFILNQFFGATTFNSVLLLAGFAVMFGGHYVAYGAGLVYCRGCGERTPSHWSYCNECGARIVEGEVDRPEPVDDYLAGTISEEELERELEMDLDPEVQRLRDRLEGINGVGEETARDIVREFRSEHSLRQADRDDVTDIHGIGESTAKQLAAERLVETGDNNG